MTQIVLSFRVTVSASGDAANATAKRPHASRHQFQALVSITPAQCHSDTMEKSHNVPSQPVIEPLSPQIGHSQTIARLSGSSVESISPGHGLRFGFRRHRTLGNHVSSPSSAVHSRTIAAKCCASLRPRPDFGATDPFGFRRCCSSVTQVSAIYTSPSTSGPRKKTAVIRLTANSRASGLLPEQSLPGSRGFGPKISLFALKLKIASR